MPVVTMNSAIPNPPAPALTTPITQETIEKVVEGIMERNQQQQQPEQKKKQTKMCLACGQPKSHYDRDGFSINFFYQQAPVGYFYCSTKVFKAYSIE